MPKYSKILADGLDKNILKVTKFQSHSISGYGENLKKYKWGKVELFSPPSPRWKQG